MHLYATENEALNANATKNVHMHARLVAWFTWGFFENIAVLGIVPIVVLCYVCNPVAGMVC